MAINWLVLGVLLCHAYAVSAVLRCALFCMQRADPMCVCWLPDPLLRLQKLRARLPAHLPARLSARLPAPLAAFVAVPCVTPCRDSSIGHILLQRQVDRHEPTIQLEAGTI